MAPARPPAPAPRIGVSGVFRSEPGGWLDFAPRERSPDTSDGGEERRRDAPDTGPGVILLTNAWFSRKRTGEEFPRQTRAALLAALITVVVLQAMVAHFPSLLRQNSTVHNGMRCHAGCFNWACATSADAKDPNVEPNVGQNGPVGSEVCTVFQVHIRVCKAFTIIQMISLSIAIAFEVAEFARPGVLSVRYRHLVFWSLFVSSMALLIWVLTILGVWLRPMCRNRLSQGWHLMWGWSISLINSGVLLGIARHVFVGGEP